LSALNALRILMPVLGTPWIFAFLAGKLVAIILYMKKCTRKVIHVCG